VAYYTQEQLVQLGFKSIGINVKISDVSTFKIHNSITVIIRLNPYRTPIKC